MTKGLEIKYKSLLNSYHINTPLRLAHFFAQLKSESQLIPQVESLYYKTVRQAKSTFYSPFKDKSSAFISQYLRNSEKMANYVYANRMGNGNEASGDGYKYRGRGFLQITGFNQYLVLSKDTGVDFLENPELLQEELHAMVSACWYWNKNNLNKHADKDNLDAISDVINIGSQTKAIGDANGFRHRKHYLELYKQYFEI